MSVVPVLISAGGSERNGGRGGGGGGVRGGVSQVKIDPIFLRPVVMSDVRRSGCDWFRLSRLAWWGKSQRACQKSRPEQRASVGVTPVTRCVWVCQTSSFHFAKSELTKS